MFLSITNRTDRRWLGSVESPPDVPRSEFCGEWYESLCIDQTLKVWDTWDNVIVPGCPQLVDFVDCQEAKKSQANPRRSDDGALANRFAHCWVL